MLVEEERRSGSLRTGLCYLRILHAHSDSCFSLRLIICQGFRCYLSVRWPLYLLDIIAGTKYVWLAFCT